jgi:hypothetical protein
MRHRLYAMICGIVCIMAEHGEHKFNPVNEPNLLQRPAKMSLTFPPAAGVHFAQSLPALH